MKILCTTFRTYIFSMSCFSSKALGRSLLLPRTRTWEQITCKTSNRFSSRTHTRGCCRNHEPVKKKRKKKSGFGGSRLTGIPCSWGLSNKLWSSFLDASTLSRSAASTMYLKKWNRDYACLHIYTHCIYMCICRLCSMSGMLCKWPKPRTHTIALTPRQ